MDTLPAFRQELVLLVHKRVMAVTYACRDANEGVHRVLSRSKVIDLCRLCMDWDAGQYGCCDQCP